jgi:hypothetical protein
LQRRDALEALSRRFQVPGTSPRDSQPRVVRPVYMPPPPPRPVPGVGLAAG